jgi:plasmid maintenance system antidote protein VapI
MIGVQMSERMVFQMDLADFIQAELDKPKSSVRKVAKWLHIAPTTVQKIAKRQIRTMPEVDTLQRIADNSGLSLPVIVEMAGAMMGDTEKYTLVARELEKSPWIANRFDELVSLNEQEFNYWMDMVKWRRKNGLPPDSTPPPPTQ